jgi:hypothetical protein
MSLFLDKIDKKVQQALNQRKTFYSGNGDVNDRYAWLYKKMPYVSVRASKANADGAFDANAAITLSTTQTLGGFPSISKKADNSNTFQLSSKNSFYKEAIGSAEKGRLVPPPNITSVSISSDGDFGSLEKVEIKFMCYSLKQLNDLQIFFEAGTVMQMTYGWTITNNTAAGPVGNWNGLVCNFGYSVTPQGTFECTTSGIGAGINAFSVALTASQKGKSPTTPGEIVKNNVLTTIKKESQDHKATYQLNNLGLGEGYGAFLLYGAELTTNIADLASTVISSVRHYVSLERLTKVINDVSRNASLDANNKSKFNSIQIVCNKDVTTGTGIVHYNLFQLSANPEEIILGSASGGRARIDPDFGTDAATYPAGHGGIDSTNTESGFFNNDTNGDEAVRAYAVKNHGDLSKIMVCVEFIERIINNISTTEGGGRVRSPQATIAKLYERIFQSIYDNTGTRYKLTLASNRNNPNELYVVEVNSMDSQLFEALKKRNGSGTKDDEQLPYEFTAFTKNAICRNISLSTKIPTEYVTAAYVAATSTLTPGATRLPGTASSDVAQPRDFKDPNATEIQKDNGTDYDRAKVLDWVKEILNAQGEAQKSKYTDVSALQSFIKEVYLSGFQGFQTLGTGTNEPVFKNTQGKTPQPGSKEVVPFPLEFSAVLDGIAGIKFGDTVSINYLPKVYREKNIVWTTTTVQHEISNNDWTTTVNTVCRMLNDE